MFQAILEGLQVDKVEKAVWLKVVWSLTTLQKAKSHHFESVLNEQSASEVLGKVNLFSQKCLILLILAKFPFSESVDMMNNTSIQTLLNINAAAIHVEKSYQGPTIPLERIHSVLANKPLISAEKSAFSKRVTEAFHSLASPPNFLWENIYTSMGFLVDAEAVFVRDTSGNYQPIGPIFEMGTLGRETLPENQRAAEKQLPQDAQRVALLTLSFKECLLGSNAPLSGLATLKIRILQQRGYKVYTVQHDELPAKTKQKMEAVKILDGKLRSLLQ